MVSCTLESVQNERKTEQCDEDAVSRERRTILENAELNRASRNIAGAPVRDRHLVAYAMNTSWTIDGFRQANRQFEATSRKKNAGVHSYNWTNKKEEEASPLCETSSAQKSVVPPRHLYHA